MKILIDEQPIQCVGNPYELPLKRKIRLKLALPKTLGSSKSHTNWETAFFQNCLKEKDNPFPPMTSYSFSFIGAKVVKGAPGSGALRPLST